MVLLAPSAAQAEKKADFLDETGGDIKAPAAHVTTELLDPEGKHRFNLTNRFSFSNGNETFSDDAVWAAEIMAAVSVTKGFALNAAIVIGLEDAEAKPNNAFFGNLRLGAYGGGTINLGAKNVEADAPKILLGGGLDVYAPTAPEFDQNTACGAIGRCDPVASVGALRSYEPQLYMTKAMSFRARLNVGFRYRLLDAQAEFAFTPGFTLRSNSDFFMLFGWAVRIGVRPIEEIEPYLQVGNTLLNGGDYQNAAGVELKTPVLLTVGARGNVVGISPALFASIDLENTGVLFGIDLAGAFSTSQIERRRGRDYDSNEVELDF